MRHLRGPICGPKLTEVLTSLVMLLTFGTALPALAVCVSDVDGDTLCDDVDACPNDGLNDTDADGICARAGFGAPMTGDEDNCPFGANPSQLDSDGDGRGDACDLCPLASGAAEDTCLTVGAWRPRAANAIARHEGGMAGVAGLTYLIGGEQDAAKTTEVYDASTNTWTTTSALPIVLHHVQPVVVQGKIYILGGLLEWPGPSVDTVRVFDPANPGLGWQEKAPLPTSRGAAGCAADGIKVYCAGGLSSTDGDTAIDAMEVYNTVTDEWDTLEPMPRERDHFHAAIIDGKFYAIGGRDTDILTPFAFNDIYDIATDTWSAGAPLPAPARGGYAIAVLQGRILVISGEGAGPNPGVFADVDEYDPVRNLWRSLANLPTPRHGIGAAISTVADGFHEVVYVASGAPHRGASTSTAHEAFSYTNMVCFSPGNEPTGTFFGSMTSDTQFTAGADADAQRDNLSTPLLFADSTTNATVIGADKATFSINVPSAGTWYAWGRFYYPSAPGSNEANSFLLQVDAGSAKKFGNNLDFFQQWHWDGNGDTETGAVDPVALGTLSAGSHTITIAKREVVSVPPRIDLVCLSKSNGPPADAEACAAAPEACATPPPSTSTTSTTQLTTTTTLAPPTSTTTTTPPTTSTTTLPVSTTTLPGTTTTLPATMTTIATLPTTTTLPVPTTSTTILTTTTTTTDTTLPFPIVISGQRLVLTDDPAPAKRKLRLRSRDYGIETSTPVGIDPVSDGAYLQVFNANGTGESVCLALAAQHWQAGGTAGAPTFRYQDRDADSGPCRSATITDGRLLKVTCSGRSAPLDYSLDEPSQGRVGIRFKSGDTDYCALFGGEIVSDVQGREFVAKRAPAPSPCLTPPAPCPAP